MNEIPKNGNSKMAEEQFTESVYHTLSALNKVHPKIRRKIAWQTRLDNTGFVDVALALWKPHYRNEGKNVKFSQLYRKIFPPGQYYEACLRPRIENVVRNSLEMALGTKVEDIFMPEPTNEATRYIKKEILEVPSKDLTFRQEQRILLDVIEPLFRDLISALDKANRPCIEHVISAGNVVALRREVQQEWEQWRRFNEDGLYAYAFARNIDPEKHAVLDLFDYQEKLHEREPSE